MSKIKVLIVFANPRNTNALRLGAEDRAIHQAIRRSRYRDNIELSRCHAATIHDVRQALLDEAFHIVHISGHGLGEGLVLEDELGNVRVIPQKALAALFKAYSPPLQCVILNACYSLSQGKLISLGVPFTIVMEGSISDEAAIEFSRGFYDAIGAGRPIDFAYGEGRRTVELAAPGTQFVAKILKSRTRQPHSFEHPSISVQNVTSKEPVLSSNLVLIDASLDPHDSPYEQTIENGRKTIRYRRQKPNRGNSNVRYDYDVALSYASEDRTHAAKLANSLKSRGVKVFYDQYEKPVLWGKDLYIHLSDLYQNKARYCVIFVSKHYAEKLWTKHELKAAQVRVLNENREYILPIRLDASEIPGILSTTAYLNWHEETPESVTEALLEKLGKVPPIPLISVSERSIMDWLIDEAQLSNGRVGIDLGDVPGVKHFMSMAKDHEDWEAWYRMWFQQEFSERMGFEPSKESITYALEQYAKMVE